MAKTLDPEMDAAIRLLSACAMTVETPGVHRDELTDRLIDLARQWVAREDRPPVSRCFRRRDGASGWRCDRCGSYWWDSVIGADWRPLSCVDRQSTAA